MKKIIISVILFIAVFPMLYAGNISSSRQENGEVVLRSLSVADGKIVFSADTGGCTDRKSFRINVKQQKDGKIPHYRITIERTVPDYCKGFFVEGVLIEIDLEKDAGLKGDYTVSITNMVYAQKAE